MQRMKTTDIMITLYFLLFFFIVGKYLLTFVYDENRNISQFIVLDAASMTDVVATVRVIYN